MPFECERICVSSRFLLPWRRFDRNIGLLEQLL